MGKEKRTLNKKIEDFVKYNWWSMSWLYIFSALFMIYSYFSIMENIEVTNKLIKKHISSVVLLTPDGRAVDVNRTQIDPDTDAFKLLIKRVMVDNLIVDLSSATRGFERQIVRNEDDIYRNSEKLNYFVKNYLAKDKQSMSMFKSHMTYLLSAINRDELPEYITPYNSEIMDYKNFPDGKFEIKVKVKFQISAFYIEFNAQKEKHGTVIMLGKGRFDLASSTPNNPLGLAFTYLQMQKIEKRDKGEQIK